jgi:hypothetical protein
VGPFEAIQGRFYQKKIIVFCAGAFAEIDEDGEKLIKCLANMAAAGNDGLTISPLLNTDRKGGASRIMLQQFRRAIGCETVCGQAKLILGRLHYVKATQQRRKQRRYVGQIIVTIHLLTEEGWHGSMIIQQGGIQHGHYYSCEAGLKFIIFM